MGKKRKIKFLMAASIFLITISGTILVLAYLYPKNPQSTHESQNITPTPVVSSKQNETTPTPALTDIPEVTPVPNPEPVAFEPVRGLYLTPNTVANPTRLQQFVDLANRTEINAYVIDIKDDHGYICYETQVPLALQHGAWKRIYDVKDVIRIFHENGIRVIGRVVCFNDPVMPLKEPDMSLKNADGSVFKVALNNSHLAWLDPSSEKAWQYIIEVAEEAVALGFDEIQYDYVRFPETTNYKYDMRHLEKEKSEYIDAFIQASEKRLKGVILSADIFGSICLQTRDAGGIGQTLETISERLLYVSPMIYPSHFANASNHYSGNGVGTRIKGTLYEKPDLEPYAIIYNSLLVTRERLENAGLETKVRPYLQGFSADYLPSGYKIPYGVDEYRAQIQAVYDAGYSEWLFWNARNTYVEEAFLPN